MRSVPSRRGLTALEVDTDGSGNRRLCCRHTPFFRAAWDYLRDRRVYDVRDICTRGGCASLQIVSVAARERCPCGISSRNAWIEDRNCVRRDSSGLLLLWLPPVPIVRWMNNSSGLDSWIGLVAALVAGAYSLVASGFCVKFLSTLDDGWFRVTPSASPPRPVSSPITPPPPHQEQIRSLGQQPWCGCSRTQ